MGTFPLPRQYLIGLLPKKPKVCVKIYLCLWLDVCCAVPGLTNLNNILTQSLVKESMFSLEN